MCKYLATILGLIMQHKNRKILTDIIAKHIINSIKRLVQTKIPTMQAVPSIILDKDINVVAERRV